MKILASDFDNTLYVNDENTLKKNITSLKEFISKGNLFCIITGRSYTSIKVLLNKYQIPYNYLICEDGAKIFNNVDYCIESILLPSSQVEIIQQIFKKYNLACFLEDGYNITENPNDCVKVLAEYTDRQVADEIVKELHEKTETYAYVSREHINVTSNQTNKKDALKTLMEKEKLNSYSIFVIGDDINDYEMLKEYPGAVMKNHHPKLDELQKNECEKLYEYIEELINY